MRNGNLCDKRYGEYLGRGTRLLLLSGLSIVLAGCSTFPAWLPASGPSSDQVADSQAAYQLPVVDVTDAVARKVMSAKKHGMFSELLAKKGIPRYTVGAGDVLEVSIWEAPPAALFGVQAVDPRVGVQTTRTTSLPEQMVAADGTINLPFSGSVLVAGKTPQQIEAEVVHRLTGKANQPQVLVRVSRNATSNATVVGEVTQSLRLPLTAKGERLLDALAAAGGVKQPVNKMTIQLSRNGQTIAMPMEEIVQDPRQNVVLQPGDVLTALHLPLSFTALGAINKNEEINFEAQGISLAQALGRIGGLQDMRADSMGVFIFRFEEPSTLGLVGSEPSLTPEGKMPVVFRVDLKDPRSFLVAQGFPIKNKDVLYVSNAPGAELQKFINILTTSIYSVAPVAYTLK
jgi:polysaccharide export outer membrane protein